MRCALGHSGALGLLCVALLIHCGKRQEGGHAASSMAAMDLSTGITLKYIEAGPPDGEAVILLHGFTDTSRSFYPLIRHLTRLRSDLHVFALDQRGHGGSSMPPAEECRSAPERCFEPEDFAADVIAFMDAQGIPDAHLVGHSLGSFVAQEVALRSPERVHKLVLIATVAKLKDHPVVKDFLLAGVIEGPWKAAAERKGLTWPDDVYRLAPTEVDPQARAWMAREWVVDPVADPDFVAAILTETARTPLGTWVGTARALNAFDNTERLKALTVPVLVIWPTQDNVFTEPDQVTLRASLDAAAERCRTGYVWKQYGKRPLPPSAVQEDDIGHNVQWGAPEAVALDLAAYLRKNGRPTGDLFYADSSHAGAISKVPGQGVMIERPARSCPP